MDMELEPEASSDDDRETPIREKLSHMSIEELLKLKEQLGTKVFDETMFGPSKKRLGGRSEKYVHEGRRVTKNKPLEMSSKNRPRKTLPAVASIAVKPKPKTRDPRFDSLCGEFREETFKHFYGFLDEIQDKELKQLGAELEDEPDGDRKTKMRYLIQRKKNQDMAKDQLKKKEEKLKIRRQAMINSLNEGNKPEYHSKSEVRVLDLIDKYKELKSTNSLQKHMNKQRRKNATEGRKLLEQDAVGND